MPPVIKVPNMPSLAGAASAVGGAIEQAKRLYLFPLVGYRPQTVPSIYAFGKPQTVTAGYGDAGIGPKNNGADLGVPARTKIQAVAKGVVLETRTYDPTPGKDPGWGNAIKYRDEYGVIHRNAHMREPTSYQPGDVIEQGTILGEVGATGNATGAHLDWEWYENGTFQDPLAAEFVEPETIAALHATQAEPEIEPTAPGDDAGPVDTPAVVDPAVEQVAEPLITPQGEQAPATPVTTPDPLADERVQPIITPEQEQTPPTTTTEDPEATRARLRQAGLSEDVVNQLTGYRGAYKMRRLRRVPEVFAPKPEQVDGERMADLLQIVALDGGIDPRKLAGELEDINLVGSSFVTKDNPGEMLFDAVWPLIAEHTGLSPLAVDGKRARELLKGGTEKPLETSTFYHGTGRSFNVQNPDKLDPNALYGPGLYASSDTQVVGTGDRNKPGYAENRGVTNMSEEDVARLEEIVEEIDRINAMPAGLADSSAYLDKLLTEATAIEQRSKSGGQVRKILVPNDLRLLDIEDIFDEPLEQQMLAAAERSSGPYGAEDLAIAVGEAHELADRLMRNILIGDIYRNMTANLGTKAAANDFFAQIGYDGLKYGGGKRRPMQDDTGKPITHDTVVIFPDAMGRVQNAMSGTAEGPLETDRALLQVWAEANPMLAESLAAMMGFTWSTPESPLEHTPAYLTDVSEVEPTHWGGAAINVEFGNVPNEVMWNKLVSRLAAVGVAPTDVQYEGGTGRAKLLVADETTAQTLQSELLAYAQAVPGGWGQPTTLDLDAPRHPSVYEVVPGLFARKGPER